jgi:hypothetical protein
MTRPESNKLRPQNAWGSLENCRCRPSAAEAALESEVGKDDTIQDSTVKPIIAARRSC